MNKEATKFQSNSFVMIPTQVTFKASTTIRQLAFWEIKMKFSLENKGVLLKEQVLEQTIAGFIMTANTKCIQLHITVTLLG